MATITVGRCGSHIRRIKHVSTYIYSYFYMFLSSRTSCSKDNDYEEKVQGGSFFY